MPLFNKKSFSPLPNPGGCLPSDLVFQWWPTGEIFADYAAYTSALWHRNAPHWTCSVTGKHNLTLPEALASEEAALASLDAMPEPWRRLSACIIHHSLHSLNHAAAMIWEESRRRFLEGEEGVEVLGLMSDGGDERMFGRILKITPSMDVGAEQVRLELFRDAEMRECVGEGTVIGSSCLARNPRKNITKNLIKRYLRSIARRSSPFEPWQLDRTVAERYGLPTSLPEDISALSAAANNDAAADGSGNHGKKKKNKQDSSAGSISVPERVIPLQFPMEDLLLPPEHRPGNDDLREVDFPLLQHCYQSSVWSSDDLSVAATVWSFFSAFPKSLSLSPFPFDDWIAALSHDSTSALLNEAFCSLFEPFCEKIRGLDGNGLARYIAALGHCSSYMEAVGRQEAPTTTGTSPVIILQSSKKNLGKWSERGSFSSLGMTGCLVGLAAEAVRLAQEQSLQLIGWDRLLDSLQKAKRQKGNAHPHDLLFFFNIFLHSFFHQHRLKLRDIVDGEVERSEDLREKAKDLLQEQQVLALQIKSLEEQLPSVHAFEKERKRLESALRKTRQAEAAVAKKRASAERDSRKIVSTYRAECLGQDRFHRTYWWLDGWRAAGGAAQVCGKIFVEPHDGHQWRAIDSVEAVDRLRLLLRQKGIREGRLAEALSELYEQICDCLIPFSPSSDDANDADADAEPRRRGGTRKHEPSFLRYKNKLQ